MLNVKCHEKLFVRPQTPRKPRENSLNSECAEMEMEKPFSTFRERFLLLRQGKASGWKKTFFAVQTFHSALASSPQFIYLFRFSPHISDVPVCRPGLPQTYSVDRGEIADIRCEVESNPAASDFRWKFNTSSADIAELPTHGEAKNSFEFKPQSENDYGTVLCWGLNSIGMQTEPCVFQVVPAGKPEPLTNCTVVNQTQHSFQVTCVEGYDGGHQQDFIAELYYAREKFVTTSISSR
jgi:hypothetical protein